MLTRSLATLSFVMALPGTPAASADDFPSRPIRVVTVEAGGGTDFVARLVARGLTDSLGVPVNSVKELIVMAQASPGKLNCATGNAGTSNHLASELFKAMAGVNIVRIVRRPDMRERFLRAGLEPVGSSPQELVATMRAEMAQLGKVIKEAGIRAE